MKIEKIKELVSIRNNKIEEQIRDIKKVYNIDVTNELLEQLVVYSLNAVKYYNEKYNCFSGNEYEQLFIFADDVYNTCKYKYNLLTSANLNNNYLNFCNTLNNNISLISEIFTIIQIQIMEVTQKENYVRKERKINKLKINKNEMINLNLPFHEKTLLLTYFYLSPNKNEKIENIVKLIKNNLESVKNGSCELFEKIFFNFADCYEKTNMRSEFYLEILCQNEDNYNYELHKKLLESLKEII